MVRGDVWGRNQDGRCLLYTSRSYTDNQGIKRKAFEIVADNVYFAEPKRDSASAPSYDPAPASAPAAPTSYQSGDAGDFQEIEDDDLPF